MSGYNLYSFVFGEDDMFEITTNGKNKNELPIIYSCSGCSDIAQLANHIALEFDRMELAEMSCIAGVGGGVKPLVKKAKSGRKIIAVDGCSLQCAKHCLNNVGADPDHHYTLTDFGLKKKYHQNFNPGDADQIINIIAGDIEKDELANVE